VLLGGGLAVIAQKGNWKGHTGLRQARAPHPGGFWDAGAHRATAAASRACCELGPSVGPVGVGGGPGASTSSPRTSLCCLVSCCQNTHAPASKTFSKKIDQISNASFSSIFLFYRVFGCFSAMGVQKHYKNTTKTFYKKVVSKTITKKSTTKNKFSIFFNHVFGHFLARGVRKHHKNIYKKINLTLVLFLPLTHPPTHPPPPPPRGLPIFLGRPLLGPWK
jgi:hypothetical protein